MGFGLGLRMGLGFGSRCSAVFLLFRSGGWVGGEMEIKANLSLSLVEVEAELGKIRSSWTKNLNLCSQLHIQIFDDKRLKIPG